LHKNASASYHHIWCTVRSMKFKFVWNFFASIFYKHPQWLQKCWSLKNKVYFLRLCKLSFCRHLSDDKIPWQEREWEKKSWQHEIYSTSLHVNFFQNNIQMKCLLTLNLLTVTFFPLSCLTSFTRSSHVKLTCGMGWTDANWILKNFFFCLSSSRVLFILIPSSSHHIHNQNSQFTFYMSVSCVRHLMRYLLWDICAYMIFFFFLSVWVLRRRPNIELWMNK
jgi:hypothetical protein